MTMQPDLGVGVAADTGRGTLGPAIRPKSAAPFAIAISGVGGSTGWRPQVAVPVEADQAETLFKLLETLDDNDDVQRVVSNVEFDDAVLERLSA